jgi:hypothetical protein
MRPFCDPNTRKKMKSLNDRIKAATTMKEVTTLINEGETYKYRSVATRNRNLRLAADRINELSPIMATKPINKQKVIPILYKREKKA